MAEISGKLFIAMGLIVGVTSLVIVKMQENSSFYLFAGVGGIFFIYGIIKMALRSGKKKNEKVQEQHPHQQNQNNAQQNHDHAQHNMSYCQGCRSKVPHYANYCPFCGSRLR